MKSKCGKFFQYLQYAPRNWIRTCAVPSPMCLSSLLACEKDVIMWWALANKTWDIWESHVSESCFRAHSREKGIIIIIFIQRTHQPLSAKCMDFLGGIMATQSGCSREIRGIIKCLSNWVRDWWSVYSLDEVCTAELMPFMQLFSNLH